MRLDIPTADRVLERPVVSRRRLKGKRKRQTIRKRRKSRQRRRRRKYTTGSKGEGKEIQCYSGSEFVTNKKIYFCKYNRLLKTRDYFLLFLIFIFYFLALNLYTFIH
jgi:hypothetical protein